jgi:hypothetical protein
MNAREVYLNEQDKKESELFDEIIQLPMVARKRLLDSVRAWEAVEANKDLFAKFDYIENA